MNRRPRHLEDTMQIHCTRWFTLQYPQYANLLHHSPNGGKRNAIEAARFKRMGVRAGFPDFVLLLPRWGYHGLFVELKTEKGRQTDNQKGFQRILTEQGYRYELCRSLDDFINLITKYLEDE